jgi:hypothetical protein
MKKAAQMSLAMYVALRAIVGISFVAILFCAHKVGPWASAMVFCWIVYSLSNWLSDLAWKAYKNDER